MFVDFGLHFLVDFWVTHISVDLLVTLYILQTTRVDAIAQFSS